MLTLFATPRAFRGNTGVIQTNAIQSWLLLHPDIQIILLGDEDGTAEVVRKFGVLHLPYVGCNEYRTPFLNSVFDVAQSFARYGLVCYVNADIILLGDFIEAVKRIYNSDFIKSVNRTHEQSFLIVGQRYDVDLDSAIDFNDHEWDMKVREYVKLKGQLHPKSGSDYFVFTRGMYNDIPSFAVGRGGWDNWLIYQARFLGVPVIDATRVVTAIHQNHDYSHIPNGNTVAWKGTESIRNAELMEGEEHAFTIEHSNWKLIDIGMKRELTMRKLYFELAALPVLVPYLHFLSRPMQALTKLIITIRKGFVPQIR